MSAGVIKMRIEGLAFVAFPLTDLGRSREFYTRVLGLDVIDQTQEHVDVRIGDMRLYLYRGEYRRQHSGLQFIEADVDAACRELAGATEVVRGTVRSEPWGGRVLTVADTDGNLFDLLDASIAQSLLPSATRR